MAIIYKQSVLLMTIKALTMEQSSAAALAKNWIKNVFASYLAIKLNLDSP